MTHSSMQFQIEGTPLTARATNSNEGKPLTQDEMSNLVNQLSSSMSSGASQVNGPAFIKPPVDRQTTIGQIKGPDTPSGLTGLGMSTIRLSVDMQLGEAYRLGFEEGQKSVRLKANSLDPDTENYLRARIKRLEDELREAEERITSICISSGNYLRAKGLRKAES